MDTLNKVVINLMFGIIFTLGLCKVLESPIMFIPIAVFSSSSFLLNYFIAKSNIKKLKEQKKIQEREDFVNKMLDSISERFYKLLNKFTFENISNGKIRAIYYDNLNNNEKKVVIPEVILPGETLNTDEMDRLIKENIHIGMKTLNLE